MIGKNLAVDFGSSNLTVFAEGKNIVISEPSVIVCDAFSGKPIAMGSEAAEMSGKLPLSMKVIHPIKDGIISDFDMACYMLRTYMDKICYGKIFRPSVLMCVPSTVTSLEKKTIFDCMIAAGAGRACFVDQALAAAIGAGVSLSEPKGTFICDIGGGTTDSAVVTMGNIAVSRSLKLGGNDFSRSIKDYVFHEFGISIGDNEAEEIKITIGSAVLRNEEISLISCGKSSVSSVPQYFEINSTAVYWTLKSHIESIENCIRSVLEITPPELSADISDNGIILTGGSSRLYGLDKYIERSTGLKTVRAYMPENCSATGMGRILKNMAYLEKNGYVFSSAEDELDETDE